MVLDALNRERVCTANHGHTISPMKGAEFRLIGDGFLAEDRELIMLNIRLALKGIVVRILDDDLEGVVRGKYFFEELLFGYTENTCQFSHISLGLREENRL
jgi:hypothetical protein